MALPPLADRVGASELVLQALGVGEGVLGGDAVARAVPVGADAVATVLGFVEADKHWLAVPLSLSTPLAEEEPLELAGSEGRGCDVTETLTAPEALLLTLPERRADKEGLPVVVGSVGVAVLSGGEGVKEPEAQLEGLDEAVSLREASREALAHPVSGAEGEVEADATEAVPHWEGEVVADAAALLLEEPLFDGVREAFAQAVTEADRVPTGVRLSVAEKEGEPVPRGEREREPVTLSEGELELESLASPTRGEPEAHGEPEEEEDTEGVEERVPLLVREEVRVTPGERDDVRVAAEEGDKEGEKLREALGD